jgi:hypothetical protein
VREDPWGSFLCARGARFKKGIGSHAGGLEGAALALELEREYGRGFAEKNLRRMVQFAEVFPEEKIIVSLIRQLSWTHFLALILLKDPLQREFYAEMCRVERWSPSRSGGCSPST